MQEQLIVNSKELDYDEDDYVFYDEKLFSGIEHWFYDTGDLGSELSYVDGIQDGWTRGWHKNGQMSGETFYKKGIVKGIYREWHENGQLKLETDVGENNSGDTVWKREWDELGNLINETKYVQ